MTYIHYEDYVYLNKILGEKTKEDEKQTTKDWGICLESHSNYGSYLWYYLCF